MAQRIVELLTNHHLGHQCHPNHHCIAQADQPSASGSSRSQSPNSPFGSPTMSTVTQNYDDDLQNTGTIDASFYHRLMEGEVDGLREDLESQNLRLSDKCSDDSTALHVAASANQGDIIAFIVSQDRNLLLCPNSSGDLPIHVAVRTGHLDAATKLVICADDRACQMLETSNDDKNTALHIALENHQEEMAMYLFDKCPHTFYRLNAQGQSPLYLAIKAGFQFLVNNMLEHEPSGDVEQQLCQGKPSVVHAAITARKPDILAGMLEMYSELVYSLDEKERSPLSYAAYIGFLDGVKHILDKFETQPFKADNDGSFPIHAACRGGSLPVVKEFLSRGSGSMRWLLNGKGQNIFHVAAESGQVKVVSYLLRSGNVRNLINMKDKDGNTPLHLATLGKHPKVVYALTWDKDVKLNLQNKAGCTAFDLAEDCGEVPSFEERLTWLALRYAGVQKAPVHITTQNYTDPNMINYIVPSELVHNYIPGTLLVETENQNPFKKRHSPKRKNKYKERLNTLLMVSTLVATVTFAAGFTVPGGYYQDKQDPGLAILAHKTAFQVFVISNTIAMYSSILAVVTLIWAHLDDLRLILLSLDFALPLLGTALAMMAVAYMAGLYVVLHNRRWLGIVVVVMGGVFLGALSVFFVPLNSPTSRVKSRILRYVVHVPFKLMLLACEKGPRQSFY